MKTLIKNNVYWVGKNDWDLRKFHGDELSTHRGTSYNSYLIMEEKNILVDTVWQPYAKEFISNLSKEIDLKKIDFILALHGETDHSGALPDLMALIPDTPIYCTENGVKSLKGHYHQDWNFKTVKTGDTLDIGNGKKLMFIQAPMLHWPDTMFAYLTEDNILFSNDAFGQHYCTEFLYNDQVDQYELYYEAMKYYANILTPFSKPVNNKIREFASLNLPLDMILTSHGVSWRDNPMQIVEKYLEWAAEYHEDQVTIVYDTMWNGTRIMGEKIAEGIRKVLPEITVKIFNASNTDKNDIITEIFRSKAVLVGSPTVNKGVLVSIAGLLEMMKGMRFLGKKGAAFGCYGWHAESTTYIEKELTAAGIEIIGEKINALWNPDEAARQACVEYGTQLAAHLK